MALPAHGWRFPEPSASEATFHRAFRARGTNNTSHRRAKRRPIAPQAQETKHKARTMRDTHRMNCLPHSKLLDADHAPSQVFVLMDRNHTSLGMLGSYAPTRAAARSFHSHGLAHRYRRNRCQEMCVTLPARLHSETRLPSNVRSVRTPLYPERRNGSMRWGAGVLDKFCCLPSRLSQGTLGRRKGCVAGSFLSAAYLNAASLLPS